MKNLLAYTPEPFDNLEYAPLVSATEPLVSATELELEESEARRRRSDRVSSRGRLRGSSLRSSRRTGYPKPRRPQQPQSPQGSSGAGNSSGGSSTGDQSQDRPDNNPVVQDVSSEHVRWVQETLNRALGLRLLVDGIMNRETRSAVRMFQERKGMPVTGMVGPDTEEALRAEGGQAAAEPELLEGDWEMPDSRECSCGGREMEEFVFEAEPFGGAEFEEWENETAQGSPGTLDSGIAE